MRKITFRVTEEQFTKLQWNAKKNNQTMTGYIRTVALNNETSNEVIIRTRKTYLNMLDLYQTVEKMEKNATIDKKNYTEIKEKVEDIVYELLQDSERK